MTEPRPPVATEEVLVCDPHQHFWSPKRHRWLQGDGLCCGLDFTAIKRNYFPAQFVEDAASPADAAVRFKVVKSVNVEANAKDDPAGETAWLQSLADAAGGGGFPHGIVAFEDLSAPDLAARLALHAQHRNLRGIRFQLDYHPTNPLWRQTARDDWCRDPAWRKGLALLPSFDLVFDLEITVPQYPDAVELAASFPGVTMVLNHCGFPFERDAQAVSAWRDGVTELARHRNVACKISGLGMTEPKWTVESIRPFVEHCLKSFGFERCMFASNFPVDSLFSSYHTLYEAFYRIAVDAGCSVEQRRALFHDNACRYYRL